MMSIRIFAISALTAVLAAPVLGAVDLSRYREFQFGMNLPTVAKQAGLKPSEAKLIHQRPALIQELEWQPRSLPGSPVQDSVKDVRFSFYNGELFQMVINYDRYRTEGLTAEDLVESISAKYGTPTKPAGEMVFPSIYDESVKILARWEDAEYSFNLVRSSYQSSFGVIGFSKRLDTLVQAATTEARRLDQQEAPQREIDRNRKEEDEKRGEQEKARRVNRPGFRP